MLFGENNENTPDRTRESWDRNRTEASKCTNRHSHKNDKGIAYAKTKFYDSGMLRVLIFEYLNLNLNNNMIYIYGENARNFKVYYENI